MQACARIGATHSVVFGGFSAEALRDRILDAGCRVVITADGGFRRGQVLPLKPAVDQALINETPVEHVVVYRRTGADITMVPGRDHDWDALMEAAPTACEAIPLDSEHPLFILYTSGTTGKPKGIVHSTGGYLLGAAYSSHFVFDLKDEDLFWCTADAGWITGHTYLAYGPLARGATIMMYEGAPNHPAPDRMWEIIERHGVTIFYTAPTAIRSFIRWGEQHPKKHDLSSLRLLGTVGEPINPEAWMWYHHIIGGGRCPIVDTWWQTETGSIIISPLPGVTATTPGTATRALPGYSVDVARSTGESAKANEGGLLVIRKPWPSMLRTIHGDPERYAQTYWSEIEGCYFSGDGARRDEAGNIWIMGRVDDVMNVSGHRLSTMEIESALVSHPDVAEAAVVGRPDDLTGEAIVAFVTLRNRQAGADIIDALKAHVVKEIGALARPADIHLTEALPKTRSGKIMRRLLRAIAGGEVGLGDTSTLEDRSVLERLKARYEDQE